MTYHESLTHRLRQELAPVHAELESKMDLPGRLKTLADYTSCLCLFHGIFAPLEQMLGRYTQWAAHGIDFDERRRTPSLQSDLRALGQEDAAVNLINPLIFDGFSEAFGALYVLEGSTLGGKFILSATTDVLGARIAGATRFFAGHGPKGGSLWRDLTIALDRYGQTHPNRCNLVISGAASCYGLFTAASVQQFP